MEAVKSKHKKVNKGKSGGKQPGAGRPRGMKNKATLEKEDFLRQFHEGVQRRTLGLLSAQSFLAHGTLKVFRIDTRTVGKGKDAKRIREKPVIVENDEEIIAALDYAFAQGESPNDDDTYYFISTKDPDNQAINSLLDRTFGKPKEQIAIAHSGSVTLKELAAAAKTNVQ